MSAPSPRKMRHTRLPLAAANAFVAEHHRHHPPARGHFFSLGALQGYRLVGVAIVGRPVSRHRDDGLTAEVTRLCTDGASNACSFLYGRAARAAFALGFRRIGTYTLPGEGGVSLRAAGWRWVGERGGGTWSRPSRARLPSRSPETSKWLWELRAPTPDRPRGTPVPWTVRIVPPREPGDLPQTIYLLPF